ncbi:MAG: hypothetical protein QXG03_12950 [Halalkalicoccus sp.]
MSDAEIEAFESALKDLEGRVTEFLVEGTDQTPEEIEEAIAEYDMPDPFEDRPVDGAGDDE